MPSRISHKSTTSLNNTLAFCFYLLWSFPKFNFYFLFHHLLQRKKFVFPSLSFLLSPHYPPLPPSPLPLCSHYHPLFLPLPLHQPIYQLKMPASDNTSSINSQDHHQSVLCFSSSLPFMPHPLLFPLL